MEVDTPRGQSVSSSTNSSRATLMYSDMFFITYTECIQALANNLIWTDQVELSKSQGPTLSYTTSKVEEKKSANQAKATKLILDPHSVITNDILKV